MLSLTIYNSQGKEAGKMELPAELFGAKLNPALMAQAVRVYLSNQRSADARAKDRGEIDRTKAKWFRQKGTGRARHGSRSAAIFVGGYKAHGPSGTQNYRLKMSQKMRQAALRSALTTQFNDQHVVLIEGLEKMAPKTREADQLLKSLKLVKGKVTLVMPEKVETVIRAFRNLPNVALEQASDLNTYTTLNAGTMVFTREAIEAMVKALAKSDENKKEAATPTQVKTTVKKSEVKTDAAPKVAKKVVKKAVVKKTEVKKVATKSKAKVAVKK